MKFLWTYTQDSVLSPESDSWIYTRIWQSAFQWQDDEWNYFGFAIRIFIRKWVNCRPAFHGLLAQLVQSITLTG
jgi:hypothetical protein